MLNTPDEMIEVIQAIKDDKEIECFEHTREWLKTENTTPNFAAYRYRVKLDKIVRYVNVYETKQYIYDSKVMAEIHAGSDVIRVAVKLVEADDE